MSDPRLYPDRPYLAVSAAIVREGRVLLTRRAQPPLQNLFTLPGGAVEAGETLEEAVKREVLEETAITIAPVALAGHREVIIRDRDSRTERHFVILCFAARWLSGEPSPSVEIAETRWVRPAELAGLPTTEGLAEIIASAFARLQQS